MTGKARCKWETHSIAFRFPKSARQNPNDIAATTRSRVGLLPSRTIRFTASVTRARACGVRIAGSCNHVSVGGALALTGVNCASTALRKSTSR
jgi:hypothetical protein